LVPSQPLIALPLAGLLVLFTRPIARRLAKSEKDPDLFKFLMWAVVIHLVFAPLQIWVVDHYYHGITDYNRYVDQGAVIGHHFDHFQFSVNNIEFLGEGAVSYMAGVVFAIVGSDKLAVFFVFNWFSFLGSVCFFRAFRTTFPEDRSRRYQWLIFYLPSILFWTAGVAKETIMYVGLGVAALGAAKIMAQKRGGAILLGLGTLLGVYIRPQEFLLFLSCVAMATLFRRRSRRPLGFLRRCLVIGAQVGLIVAAVALTNELGKHGGNTFDLTAIAKNNRGQSSSINYTPGPKGFFKDLYYTLIDPLVINAHGKSQLIASFENLTLVALAVNSLKRVRHFLRVCVLRPYVLASLVYCVLFCYAFAALGNLGLIDRERVLMLPFLLVFFSIPISPKDSPRQYEWEVSHKVRKRRRREETRPRAPAWH
jgi:hypothetical protein